MDSRDAIWLSVLPDMSGFGNSFTQEVGKQGDKGGGVFGTRFSKAFAAGAAITGTAVVATKQLHNIGRTFDEMSDTIAISSGQTGEELEVLVESAKTVGTQIPADFNAVGDALATLNTLTGATGDSLEDMTSGVMEASRLLGEDASSNAEAFGKSLAQWQIPAEEGTAKLDAMFVATQDYGVSLNGLMGHMNSFGPIMQNAGYEMEEAAVFFSQLEAGGISVSRVMPALNASFRNWAAEGKDSREEFEKTVATIRDTEDATEALALASDTFGAQGAQRLTTAIRNGTLDIEDFSTALEGSEGAIKATADETDSFGEKWTVFKNKAMAALEPVGTAIFDGLGAGMTWLTDTAFPAVTDFWDQNLKPVWDSFYSVIVDDLVPAIQSFWEDTLQPAITKIGEKVEEVWEGVVQPAFEWLAEFITETVIPTVKELWEDSIQPAMQSIQEAFQAAWDIIEPILESLLDWIENSIGPILEWLQTHIVEPVWEAITNAISTAWDTIKGIFETIKNVLSGDFAQAWESAKTLVSDVWDGIWNQISSVWNDWILPLLKGVGDQLHTWFVQPFQDAVDAVGRAWDNVKEWFREPINWVIRNVINGGVIDFINAITGALGLSSLKIGYVNTIGPPSAPRTSTPRPAHMGGGNTFSVNSRAKGGYTPPGWTLVGEEGPELVNFTAPNRVYTAAETRDMLAQVSPDILRDDRKYSRSELGTVTDALAGDPMALALAAGTSEQDALLPMGGLLGRFGDWVSDAWDGITSWTADIAGKAFDFVRGKLADTAKLVINPLQGLVRNNVSGVFGDFFVGAGDKLIDWIRGVDSDTEDLVALSGAFDNLDPSMFEGMSSSGGFRPVRGPVTSRFGPRWGGHHAGIDWAVPVGTPVRAWRDGIVRRAGWNSLTGRTGIGMEIGHAAGFGSYYGHLSAALKSVGQRVRAGEIIARSGNTGRSTGPHLHFEISRNGNPQAVVNPERYLYDEGGWLQPGLQMVRNATGKPEAVLTPEQSAALLAFTDVASSSSDKPLVGHFYGADGVLIGTMDGRIEKARQYA